MLTVLLTVAGIAAAMFAMAVGVMVGGRALRGSCGGVASECMCSATDMRRCAKRIPGATE